MKKFEKVKEKRKKKKRKQQTKTKEKRVKKMSQRNWTGGIQRRIQIRKKAQPVRMQEQWDGERQEEEMMPELWMVGRTEKVAEEQKDREGKAMGEQNDADQVERAKSTAVTEHSPWAGDASAQCHSQDILMLTMPHWSCLSSSSSEEDTEAKPIDGLQTANPKIKQADQIIITKKM